MPLSNAYPTNFGFSLLLYVFLHVCSGLLLSLPLPAAMPGGLMALLVCTKML